MQFEATRDYALIRALATRDPRVWDAISDDFTPAREDWQPGEHESLVYVVVREGEEPLGFFLLAPQSSVLWEIHTVLLPNAWGAKAKEAAQGIVAWLWQHTAAQRLITSVPAYNRLALAFAKRAGMTEFGRNPRAYQKRGQLTDLILLGLSRPEGQ